MPTGNWLKLSEAIKLAAFLHGGGPSGLGSKIRGTEVYRHNFGISMVEARLATIPAQHSF